MKTAYAIRPVELEELLRSGALEMVWKVFGEFEAPDYSARGIEEFRDFIASDSISRMMSRGGLRVWCCFEDKKVIGLIAIRPPDHISLLFVDKAYHKRGIARALYQTVLDHCDCDSDCREMTVHSSPYAQEVYRRLGFVDTGPEQTANGLRFIPMRHTILRDGPRYDS